MNYLKCNSCGHQNALKSAYLTFCGHCAKKLQGSFSEWQQQYPEKNFETYLEMIAESGQRKEVYTENWLTQQWKRHKGNKWLIASALVIILLITGGTLFGKRAVLTLLYSSAPQSWLYTSWETVAIGRQALEISSPVRLHINDQPLPPELAERAEYVKCYSSLDNSGFKIEVNMYSYWKHVSNNLEEAAGGTVNGIKATPGVSELVYKSCPALQAGIPGLLMEGEYVYKDAIRLAFRNLIIVRGTHRWQVNITYREDDKVGEKVALRVLKSVRLR